MSDTTWRILDMLERRGRDISLRRRVGTSNTFTDCSPRAVPSGYQAEELVGGIIQGDRKVVVEHAGLVDAGWPQPPRKGDIVVIDGWTATVQTTLPMYDGPAVACYILTVRG